MQRFIGDKSHRVTPREREVGSLIAKGLTNIQIADSLEVRPSTVKKHISNLMLKLDVSRRSQIAVIAATEGWHDGNCALQ